MKTIARIALASLATIPVLLAHPGHDEQGFVAGAAHPLLGVDHLLAMVAVGILAARCGGKALWVLPLTFLSCMVVGGFLALAGVPMPMTEWGIAGSVLVFGGLITLASPPRTSIAAGVIGLFALVHGHAHMAERATGEPILLYALGFLLMTALLHACGVVGAVGLKRSNSGSLIRLSGVVIAACSLVLMLGLLGR